MKRKILSKLRQWIERTDRKPLLLLGARQVGKTWAMQELGRQCFHSVAYVNCDEEPMAKSLFSDDYDMDRIMLAIQAITGIKVEPGKTLLILDELQEAPRGLHSLKYLAERMPELHVVAAGSLLGITLAQGQSFPVGKVDMLHVHPMDFDEFLMANGQEGLLNYLHQSGWKTVGAMGQKLTEQLRQYYYVGGMPEVVSHYALHRDLEAVRRLQKNILEAYRNDISKHSSKTESIRIGQVLNSLPSQLAKENKKFVYGMIRKGARAKDFELAIQWLVDAGIVQRVTQVKKLQSPLKFYENMGIFKLFLLDCGLLGCMVDAPARDVLLGDNIFKEFKGAFTEQYVLQQLVSMGLEPHYWSNDATPAEIDFALQCNGRVVPVEVKAEENVRAKSMSTYIHSHPELNLKGLRISMKDYVDQGWMENIPLWAVTKYFTPPDITSF